MLSVAVLLEKHFVLHVVCRELGKYLDDRWQIERKICFQGFALDGFF